MAGGWDGAQGEQLHRLCGSPGDDASGLWIPETWQDENFGDFHYGEKPMAKDFQ